MQDNRESLGREVELLLEKKVDRNHPTQHFDRLIELHDRCEQDGGDDLAFRLRQAFLLALDDRPSITDEVRYCKFLANKVTSDDFASLQWESPHKIIRFCEILYGFHFTSDETAEQVRLHVESLLKVALHQFEAHNDYEQMLRLVQIVPTDPSLLGGEMLRLRNRVHLYEMRRVRHSKRWLYGYLVLQAILVLFVFPHLFVYAENGKMRDAVEAATDVEVDTEVERQFLSYSDGLYWSVITAASIGYGDITPKSTEGRVIAGTLGTMGVITIGVLAGLVLNWITPRSLD